MVFLGSSLFVNPFLLPSLFHPPLHDFLFASRFNEPIFKNLYDPGLYLYTWVDGEDTSGVGTRISALFSWPLFFRKPKQPELGILPTRLGIVGLV